MKGKYNIGLGLFCLALLTSELEVSAQHDMTVCEIELGSATSESLQDLNIEILAECDRLKTLSLLRQSLTEDEWQTQVVSAYTLGEFGSDAQSAVSNLIELLSHDDERVRYSAVTALGKINAAAVAPVLLASLTDDSENVRASALVALIQNGLELDLSYLEALKNKLEKDLISRKSIYIEEAAVTGDEHVDLYAAILISAFADENWRVRESATQAFTQLLKDDRRFLESWAQYKILPGDSIIKSLLYDCFFEVSKEQDLTSLFISIGTPQAIETLGLLGEERAIPALIEIVKSEDSALSIDAVKSLGLLRAKSAGPVLAAKFEDDWPPNNPFFLEQLWQTDATDIIPFLIEKLQDGNTVHEYVTASIVLARFGSEDSAAALLDAIRSENPLIKWSAIQAFSSVPFEDSTETLNQVRIETLPILLDTLRTIEDEIDEESLTVASWEADKRNAALVYALENTGKHLFPEIVNELLSMEAGLPVFMSSIGASDEIEWNPYTGYSSQEGLRSYYFKRVGQTADFETIIQPLIDELTDTPLENNYLEMRLNDSILTFLKATDSQNARAMLVNIFERILEEKLYPEYGRSKVIEVLADNGSSKVIPILLNQLPDENNFFTYRLLESLKAEESLESLSQIASDTRLETITRLSAIQTLGGIGSTTSVPVLEALLQDKEDAIVSGAMSALAEIGGSTAVAVLMKVILPNAEYSETVQTAVANYDVHLKWRAIVDTDEYRLTHPSIVEALHKISVDEEQHIKLRQRAAKTLVSLSIDNALITSEDTLNHSRERDCFAGWIYNNSAIMTYDPYIPTCYGPSRPSSGAPFKSIVKKLMSILK